MKIGKYEIADRYIAGSLAVGAFFAGAFMANVYTAYNRIKLEQAGIEFKQGEVSINRKMDIMPDHKFPSAGVFLKGKKTPYVTYIFEDMEKRESHEPAMTLISTLDNGVNDVRITNEMKCQPCHKTVITQYTRYEDKISM